MEKVKALIISLLISLFGLISFNFTGYAGYASKATWAIWLFVNLLFIGIAIGLLVGLYFVSLKLKSQNSKLNSLLKNINIYCLVGFSSLSLVFIFDLFIFIPYEAIDIILTTFNFLIIAAILGYGTYQTVLVFKYK